MLTADEVLQLRFPAAKMLRTGYSADDVDDWLDTVILTLRAYQGDPKGSIELLADDVRAIQLPEGRGASAYATDEVDAAIERIAAALDAHESAARRS